MDKLGVVVVAAGKGSRMGASTSKQYLLLQGKPILVHTLEAFQRMPQVDAIVVVVGAGDEARCEAYKEQYGLHKIHAITAGGAERQASGFIGLQALPQGIEWAMVHDAVRPFIEEQDVERCLNDARRHGAAVLAVPVKDTVKVVSPEGRIVSTPERSRLWAIQTPQAFRLSLVLQAHEAAQQEGFIGTDDAMLVERLRHPVHVTEGRYTNIKITTPDDLEWAEHRLAREKARRPDMIRVGQGFDVHQLVEGRKCIIGGVEIPYEKGLLGHSDADVLLHAITDAILGAVAKGDIGKHFPDTDPAYRDADSLKLLQHVWALAKGMGYRLGNVDATIIAQKPKMAPYIPQMVEVIAGALEAELDQVNVKATTTEQLGFTGRGEGIASQAVVCLLKHSV